MSKKIIRVILALIALGAVAIIAQTQKEKTQAVIVAAHDLPAGYTITAEDIQSVELPSSAIPPEAITEASELIGETLGVPRSAQDVILRVHLGDTRLELASNERAIGIEVTDSAGLAGLLKAGDRVGVNAVINASSCVYSKVVAEGLRVLYVSPSFLATEPEAAPAEAEGAFGGGGGGVQQPREERGVVILAVPVAQQVIAYDFTAFGVTSDARLVNVIELLSVLDHSSKVELSLFMDPSERASFITSGLCLSDLAVQPQPSPTPDPEDELPPEEELTPEGD
ncbi:MAG: Flp pilus assembly protein CpaB [Chloroflexota bacterium]|nr:MAG: Flp pilus assembly protein CpaB [Chloroflexota bacterium]